MMRRALIALLLAACALAACAPTAWAAVPREAEQYRRELVRAAHHRLGLGAPIATLAAQIHQESAWRPGALSPAGAQGLAQVMPATARWLADLHPELAPAAPYSPGWALRAMLRYDAWLLARVPGAVPCERWAFALSGYNGGLGWVQRDVRLAAAASADPQRWWDNVEHHTARADWARRENRGYVRAVLRRWEPLYARAGWGPGVCT